ncbi:sulfite exporter TauE/SafE family protein [Pontibacter sp. JAM-7]|uniref:sulfite exporter TauE/SafE family protein n=1 Tax=Pontibacter sp. JAM-7 TaxID=3366581 RepID=UPI003AF549A8
MTEALALPTAFILGLLGGTHCLGMCGGIASSVALQAPAGKRGLGLLLGYNGGRVLSYSLAGALFGSFGWLLSNLELQLALRSLAGLMLVAMGLYIGQWWLGLTRLESAGGLIWQRLRPIAGRLLPARNIGQAFVLGSVWGWLPCGLVYSTLLWAAAAADWRSSALLMAGFGLGTLPVMLLTGLFAQQVKQLLQQQLTRQLAGLTIIAMGLFSLPWRGLIDYLQQI